MKETEKENSKNQPLQNPAQIPPAPSAKEQKIVNDLNPDTNPDLIPKEPLSPLETDLITGEQALLINPEENVKINDIDTTPDEPEEEEKVFTKNLPISEKQNYETIVKAQKKTIAALREENIGLHAANDSLTKQIAELTFLSEDSNPEQ